MFFYPHHKECLRCRFLLNAENANHFREIGELDIQLRTLEGQQEKLRGESSSLKSHLATLNRFFFPFCLKCIVVALWHPVTITNAILEIT